MKQNPYSGKFTPHLSIQNKEWFVSLDGRLILPRKKGAGFIVMEGLDGSGQSTQVELLTEFLKNKGHRVLKTKEPTKDSRAGKLIRKILDKKEKISPKELQQLFSKDRKWHLQNVIIPALKNGKIVISDRYFFSSFAYGTASGLDLDWLIKINDKFLLPDLTFVLRVSPEVCLKRIQKRGKDKTLFEEKEKLAKVWQTYKILPNRFENVYPVRKSGERIKIHKRETNFSNGVYIINGERPIEEVFNNIKKIINEKI